MRRLSAWLLALALSGVGARAAAASATDAGRAEGERGLAAYDAGRFADALEHFRAADLHFHAPTLVLFQARCESRLGHVLAARALYERVLAEPITPGAPAAFRDARTAARAESTALRARLGTLRVRVAAPASGPVAVDDARAGLGTEIVLEVDPGPHVASVTTDAGERLEARADVGEGAVVEVVLAPAAAPAEASSGVAAPALAFALGGVGLGVGIATGAISLAKTSDIRSRCDGAHCLTSDEADGKTASTLAAVSTVGFVIAGLGVATGVTLVVLRARRHGAPAAATAGVGPGFVTLAGRF